MEGLRPNVKENETITSEKVDNEVKQYLANERAGSPVIRSLGNYAALIEAELHTKRVTNPQDPRYYKNIARLEAVRETRRREGLGVDVSEYVAAERHAIYFIQQYAHALQARKPQIDSEARDAVAASLLQSRVEAINWGKSRVRAINPE